MNTTAVPFLALRRATVLLAFAAWPVLASAGDIQGWLVLSTANPAAPETILSTDVLEKGKLVRANWKVSGAGVLQTDAVADSAPVFRMFHPLPKGGVARMLAVTKDEADARTKVGYVTEGELGNVSLKAGPGMVPVIRFVRDGRYLWVISAADQAWAEKTGWKREKVAFWLWPDTYKN